MMSFKEFLDSKRPTEINVTIGNKSHTIYWKLEFDIEWDDLQRVIFTPMLTASGTYFNSESIKELFGVSRIEIELPEPIVKYTLSSDIDILNDQFSLVESIEFISKVKEQLERIENKFKSIKK